MEKIKAITLKEGLTIFYGKYDDMVNILTSDEFVFRVFDTNESPNGEYCYAISSNDELLDKMELVDVVLHIDKMKSY